MVLVEVVSTKVVVSLDVDEVEEMPEESVEETAGDEEVLARGAVEDMLELVEETVGIEEVLVTGTVEDVLELVELVEVVGGIVVELVEVVVGGRVVDVLVEVVGGRVVEVLVEVVDMLVEEVEVVVVLVEDVGRRVVLVEVVITLVEVVELVGLTVVDRLVVVTTGPHVKTSKSPELFIEAVPFQTSKLD